jgi:hypothetical protein
MLTDPENLDEQPQQYDEPIIAASPEEAERLCREIAERDGVRLAKVKQPSRVRRGQNQQYRCIAVAILFRTFLWTRGARPQKCTCPNRSGGCYIFESNPIE